MGLAFGGGVGSLMGGSAARAVRANRGTKAHRAASSWTQVSAVRFYVMPISVLELFVALLGAVELVVAEAVQRPYGE